VYVAVWFHAKDTMSVASNYIVIELVDSMAMGSAGATSSVQQVCGARHLLTLTLTITITITFTFTRVLTLLHPHSHSPSPARSLILTFTRNRILTLTCTLTLYPGRILTLTTQPHCSRQAAPAGPVATGAPTAAARVAAREVAARVVAGVVAVRAVVGVAATVTAAALAAGRVHTRPPQRERAHLGWGRRMVKEWRRCLVCTNVAGCLFHDV